MNYYFTYPRLDRDYYASSFYWTVGSLDDDSELGPFPISGDDITRWKRQ